MRYLHERRAALGGYMPARRSACARAAGAAAGSATPSFALQADGKEMSTTMAFVRMLGSLLKDPALGPRVVPIVADEARTFGMANLFKQVGIYSSVGQRYEPEDIGSVLSYREATDGQILEEGISEAGAHQLAGWPPPPAIRCTAMPMLPFYIYYSMFGFQRVGDLIWAAADQRSRGFLLGATAGRTTLGGEGLQHQDGRSLLMAATVPNCRAYDPAFAGEFAVILDHGMRADARAAGGRLLLRHADERELRAALAARGRGGRRDQGPVPLRRASRARRTRHSVRLLGSGTILREVLAAAELLRERLGHRRRGLERHQLQRAGARGARGRALEPAASAASRARRAICSDCLAGDAPIVAASDYVRAWPQLIAPLPATRRFVGARHRRLRPQRHARRAAPLLRGRPAAHRAGGAERTLRRRSRARNAAPLAIERYALDQDNLPPWQR